MNDVQQLCLDLTIETENQYQNVSFKHSSGRINKPSCKIALVALLESLRIVTSSSYSMLPMPTRYDDVYALALHVLSDMRLINQAPSIADINEANSVKGNGSVMKREHFAEPKVTINDVVESVTIRVESGASVVCKRFNSNSLFCGSLPRITLKQITALIDNGVTNGIFITKSSLSRMMIVSLVRDRL